MDIGESVDLELCVLPPDILHVEEYYPSLVVGNNVH